MRIHQLSFGMHAGDAVSNHVLDIDANLKSWGYTSHMYAQHVAPEMQGRVLLDNAFAPYLSEPNDLLIYHYSIYSPNTRLFRSAQTKRILIYHNITPAHFFHGWDARQAAMCALGRQKLPHLADCDFALSDSEFNRQELIAAGFDERKTAVLPFHITPTQFNRHTNDSTKHPGIINWLTVGRIVPNKAIEELIRLFAVYHKTINAASHLYIVGSRTIEPYAHQLDQLIKSFNLTPHITMAGRVSDTQLKAYYETADLYVTTSHHEGFCVPLIESMAAKIPILAHKATAIPETLGDAGVLYHNLGYEAVAEMAHLMVTDVNLRDQIITQQLARLRQFSPETVTQILKDVIGKVINDGCVE